MDILIEPMKFLISGTQIPPLYLMGLGFFVGIMGGFFGVGGSFLAGPALFAMGMQMNFVVGTDLAHIVGKSIVAAGRHRTLGNVDYKLGLLMVIGTIPGAEIGAQLIQLLKRLENVNLVVGIGFILVLISISTLVGWESWQSLKKLKQSTQQTKEDVSVLKHVSKRIHGYHLPPMISLPASGVEQVSDLVMVGAAPSSNFWRLLDPMWMGGLVYKILESVKIPILVVIGDPPTLSRILLCSGGAAYIDTAIKFAGHIAQCVNAKVDLFHVLPETPAMYAELSKLESDIERLLESNSDLGRNLRRQKKLLEQFGVFGDIRLRQGEVVPELLQELHGNDYDLVVTGSSPAEDIISRYLMSDVVREIVNRAMRPVLVVRTRQRLLRRFFNEVRSRLFGKVNQTSKKQITPLS